jgi:hypothetical protein
MDKRIPKFHGDVLGGRIKTFGLVELAEPGVNAAIPRLSEKLHFEVKIWEPMISRLFHTQTFRPGWIEGPKGRTGGSLKLRWGLGLEVGQWAEE